MGTETSNDAAVYQINNSQAIVATRDFFMPIVDDPFDFGAIAATNAISDVYAMGVTPIFALALVGMPISQLPMEVIRRILQGGESVCARAGIPIARGHSIDSVEPIYGLVAVGVWPVPANTPVGPSMSSKERRAPHWPQRGVRKPPTTIGVFCSSSWVRPLSCFTQRSFSRLR